MSKRHFVQMASIIATIEDLDERTRIANEFADMCKRENSFFDRTRFLMACEVY